MKLINFIKKCLYWPSSTKEIESFLSLVRPYTSNIPLIRVGGWSDGGYLVPDDFKEIKACFSPGVAMTSDFELQMAERGVAVYMADFSVDSPSISHPLFDFEKKFLGDINNNQYMTLESWVKCKAPTSGDLILQMDIEGGEYDVLLSTSIDLLCRFRIIVIEFHEFKSLRGKLGLRKISAVFEKLCNAFHLVHIHPNNCKGPFKYKGFFIPRIAEFTFIRKDRVASLSPTSIFPHKLDCANVNNLPDYSLPECWHTRIEKR